MNKSEGHINKFGKNQYVARKTCHKKIHALRSCKEKNKEELKYSNDDKVTNGSKKIDIYKRSIGLTTSNLS